MPTAGLPSPPQLVTAYDTPKGKPNPDPYLKGAEKLGIDIKDCGSPLAPGIPRAEKPRHRNRGRSAGDQGWSGVGCKDDRSLYEP